MATTVNYAASLVTRKTNYSSNGSSNSAAQEFYEAGSNNVGIICFSGMNLANKVIQEIIFTITAKKAGYGEGSTKTVYLRKANYQNSIASGVTGSGYVGDALGTFTGHFYGNTSAYELTGSLYNAVAAYLAAGNNTFTIYNPNPSASAQGYSYNYLSWSDVVITVTYEEAASQPSTSAATVAMGSAVTIYTNRPSSAVTHTISYWFGNASGAIATNVGASVSWTPPLSLASQIPNATSGICTITCNSFVNGNLTGTRTCTFTLTVPASVVPSISAVTLDDTNSTVKTRIAAYVKSLSKLSVAITAAGAYSSTISSYRTTLDGVTYTAASFTATKALSAAGSLTLTVTVTDSRGRTATYTTTITVLDYAYPSISRFTAERCNSGGTAAQVDGNKVRYNLTGSGSALNNRNTLTCTIYYKLSTASAWTQAETVTHSSYALSQTNKLMSQTFDPLYSYNLKVTVADYFYSVEQIISIGTKQVLLDFLSNGNGIGIGKVAETNGYIDCGWPLKLSTPLAIAYGGTGSVNADAAIANLGGVKKSGDTMTGNLNIQGTLYPSLCLLPTNSGQTNRIVFEGSYVGAASFAAWEDSTGNNRRMLEVRTKAYASSLDNAAMLRVCDGGTWGNYRIFHEGMATAVPVNKGGTGATTAANARSKLGANNAANLTTGTLPAARLPFKFAYGSTSINGSSATSVDYSSAGFTSVPVVLVTYSTTGSNWSGDNGAIKVHSKTTSGCSIVVGGNFSTSRAVDWFAFGV